MMVAAQVVALRLDGLDQEVQQLPKIHEQRYEVMVLDLIPTPYIEMTETYLMEMGEAQHEVLKLIILDLEEIQFQKIYEKKYVVME